MNDIEEKIFNELKIKDNHFNHLASKHESFDKKINTLLKTKSFNDIEVEKLKKEKLKLKDKIYSLVYKYELPTT